MGPTEETTAEFLNDAGEVHAVWFGFCQGASLVSLPSLPLEELKNLEHEKHYFTLGIVLTGVLIAGLAGPGAGALATLAFGPVAGFLTGISLSSLILLLWIFGAAPVLRREAEEEIQVAIMFKSPSTPSGRAEEE